MRLMQLQLVQLLHDKTLLCIHKQQMTQETIDETHSLCFQVHAVMPPILTADKQSDVGLYFTGGWCQGGSSFTMVQ